MRWIPTAIGVGLGSVVLSAALVVHDYTQSTAFCSQPCHRVMAPQFLAHRAGIHAQVPCTQCHVGAGAIAHVRAKLRGVHHLFSFVRTAFPRPIRASDPRYRTTSDRCLRCHRPLQLPRSKVIETVRYHYDEVNSVQQLALTLKLGAEDPRFGRSRGIGWHMTLADPISYAASDPDAQTIPWVQVRRTDGTSTTYVSALAPFNAAQLGELPRHEVQCSTCHQRSAHAVIVPDDALDQALSSGDISADLPAIKRHVVQALGAEYPNAQAAHRGIRASLFDAYAARFPEVLRSRKSDLERAIAFACALYDRSTFAELAVDWRSYPNPIGHRFANGCLRCHDGLHVAADGKVLSGDCGTLCHGPPTLHAATPPGVAATDTASAWHPWRLPSVEPAILGHERLLCVDCHAGGRVPSLACEDCHHAPGW